jgi:hypothetical protein
MNHAQPVSRAKSEGSGTGPAMEMPITLPTAN